MLGARNSSQKDKFFTRGRHENLAVVYISQSYFSLPRQSIRNNIDRLKLIEQTLKRSDVVYFSQGFFSLPRKALEITLID